MTENRTESERPGRGTPHRPRPEIREAILDAVDDLLDSRGYARLTIEEVAQRAGIGKGSVYLHFASKEDLVLSSVDRLIERLLSRLEETAASTVPVDERLRRMLVLRVLYRFDHLHQDSKSLDEMLAAVRTELLARRERWFEAEAERFARVLADGEADGRFETADSLETARQLVTATNAFLPYSLSKLELGRRSRLEARVEGMADLLLRAVTARRALAAATAVTDAPP